MLAEAGFAEPTFHGWTGYVTSSFTQGGLITARKQNEEMAGGPVLRSGSTRTKPRRDFAPKCDHELSDPCLLFVPRRD
jgi:hypothetical protein